MRTAAWTADEAASGRPASISARLAAHWVMKIGLGAGLIAMFGVIYVVPQRFPVFPGTAMKPLWIDRVIPFVPNTVYLYESLYLLLPIAPWLMTSRDELWRYSSGLVFMNLVGFCFFFFHPTLCPRPEYVEHANSLYRKLMELDNEFNAFPSLHVAYAVFHGACWHALLRLSQSRHWAPWGIWTWVLGISASTLLTKQHVFVDAAAGAMLGFGSYVCCCRPGRLSRTLWRRA